MSKSDIAFIPFDPSRLGPPYTIYDVVRRSTGARIGDIKKQGPAFRVCRSQQGWDIHLYKPDTFRSHGEDSVNACKAIIRHRLEGVEVL